MVKPSIQKLIFTQIGNDTLHVNLKNTRARGV